MGDFRTLKNRVAVVGAGNTACGNLPDIDDYGLGARAFRSATKDCGLDERPMLIPNVVGMMAEDSRVGATFVKMDEELTLPKIRIRN